MKDRIRPRIRQILEYLEKSNKPVGTYDVANFMNASYRGTLNNLNRLAKQGYIKKLPGNGHSYNWKFKRWVPVDTDDELPPLEARVVRNWMRIVSAPGWDANFAKRENVERISQVALDLSVLGSAVSRGEVTRKEQFARVHTELLASFNEIKNAYKILGGLLNTDELWDSKTISAFLES